MLRQLFERLIAKIHEYCAPKTAITALSARMSAIEENTDDKLSKDSINLAPQYAFPDNIPGNFIDLGLSVLWYDRYLGASEVLSDGGYYGFGEIEARETNVIPEGDYRFGESPFTKYNLDDGISSLEAEDDAATVALGSLFRLPTKDECEELISECDWRYVQSSGTIPEHIVITGPNGNSIRLPYCYGNDTRFFGFYSSTLIENGEPADSLLPTIVVLDEASTAVHPATYPIPDSYREVMALPLVPVVPRSSLTATGATLRLHDAVVDVISKQYTEPKLKNSLIYRSYLIGSSKPYFILRRVSFQSLILINNCQLLSVGKRTSASSYSLIGSDNTSAVSIYEALAYDGHAWLKDIAIAPSFPSGQSTFELSIVFLSKPYSGYFEESVAELPSNMSVVSIYDSADAFKTIHGYVTNGSFTMLSSDFGNNPATAYAAAIEEFKSGGAIQIHYSGSGTTGYYSSVLAVTDSALIAVYPVTGELITISSN